MLAGIMDTIRSVQRPLREAETVDRERAVGDSPLRAGLREACFKGAAQRTSHRTLAEESGTRRPGRQDTRSLVQEDRPPNSDS